MKNLMLIVFLILVSITNVFANKNHKYRHSKCDKSLGVFEVPADADKELQSKPATQKTSIYFIVWLEILGPFFALADDYNLEVVDIKEIVNTKVRPKNRIQLAGTREQFIKFLKKLYSFEKYFKKNKELFSFLIKVDWMGLKPSISYERTARLAGMRQDKAFKEFNETASKTLDDTLKRLEYFNSILNIENIISEKRKPKRK